MTIAYHNELAVMKEQYVEDDDFAKIYEEWWMHIHETSDFSYDNC